MIHFEPDKMPGHAHAQLQGSYSMALMQAAISIGTISTCSSHRTPNLAACMGDYSFA